MAKKLWFDVKKEKGQLNERKFRRKSDANVFREKKESESSFVSQAESSGFAEGEDGFQHSVVWSK